MKTILMASAMALLGGTVAQADSIERACMSSNRPAASRALCGCIQQVANLTLDHRDQRLAATFFSDPHKAQEVRQSGRNSDSAFWLRYKRFGDTAASYCS